VRGAEHPSHGPKLGGRKHTADAHALHGPAHLVDLADGQRTSRIEQSLGLARLRKPCAGFFTRFGERQLERKVSTERAGAPFGDGVKDAIPLEVGARLGRTRVRSERLQAPEG